jgi:hypothetical protein
MELKTTLSTLFMSALLLCSCGPSNSGRDHNAQLSIEDERQITAVLVRYATGIDRRDWKLFATCFTKDVVSDYDGIGSWKSRDEIVERMRKGHQKIGPTMHKLTNFVIAGSGDHATATSYIDALLMPLEPGGTVRRANGRYEDELVREKDGWKISKRHFVSVQVIDTPQ